MNPLDDKRFQIRLKKPFRQMLYAPGARNCFMMRERMAKTPPSEQIKEYVGSGPFRFLTSEWVSGARGLGEVRQIHPPAGEAVVFLGRPRSAIT
jgi:peptide/nickel transport system substrate-binding protein